MARGFSAILFPIYLCHDGGICDMQWLAGESLAGSTSDGSSGGICTRLGRAIVDVVAKESSALMLPETGVQPALGQ